MGLFLSLSGVVGSRGPKVVAGLRNYAQTSGGGFEQADPAAGHEDCCIIGEMNGNTTVVYPPGFMAWDEASAFLSAELKVPVFSFHIHDGDLWMYVLYVNGKVADQFNPIPDYWDDSPDEETFRQWKGNPDIVGQLVKGAKRNALAKYLVRWNLDSEEETKAYPGDEFGQEAWQLLDFLRKLQLPYPLDDDGEPKGQVYRFWTKEPPQQTAEGMAGRQKPWWKFW